MIRSQTQSVRAGAIAFLMGLLFLWHPKQAAAQGLPTAATAAQQPLTLTLDEAVQIALINNYTVRNFRLDVRNASAQVREAWGEVMPQVNVSVSFTRNLKTANPFAGSDAGELFSGLALVNWLIENEDARTDDDPTTVPISLEEYLEQQPPMPAGENPFNVPNQFQNGISVEQTLFSGSAFAAIKGAQRLKDINQRGADRQEQLLIDQVRQAFYQALLVQEQARVSLQSNARTQRTLDEVTRRVAQGVAPKFQRLSAEVELANLETQLVQVQNQAALALENLKLTLGIPMEQPLRLRGDLEVDDERAYRNVSLNDAVATALAQRPDLAQAQLAVELRQIDKEIVRAQYLPSVTAFVNANYVGNVPDNRTDAFFSSNFWSPSVNAGVRLTWNIFNGFQTSARVQQRQVAVEKARVDQEQLLQGVRLEVEQALRNLETARQRIASQAQNVGRAELNYEYAQARLREGVANPLEEREASEQLDLSRLNYLQAVHDYLIAQSAFETAVGMPLTASRDLRLTTN